MLGGLQIQSQASCSQPHWAIQIVSNMFDFCNFKFEWLHQYFPRQTTTPNERVLQTTVNSQPLKLTLASILLLKKLQILPPVLAGEEKTCVDRTSQLIQTSLTFCFCFFLTTTGFYSKLLLYAYLNFVYICFPMLRCADPWSYCWSLATTVVQVVGVLVVHEQCINTVARPNCTKFDTGLPWALSNKLILQYISILNSSFDCVSTCFC